MTPTSNGFPTSQGGLARVSPTIITTFGFNKAQWTLGINVAILHTVQKVVGTQVPCPRCVWLAALQMVIDSINRYRLERGMTKACLL